MFFSYKERERERGGRKGIVGDNSTTFLPRSTPNWREDGGASKETVED